MVLVVVLVVVVVWWWWWCGGKGGSGPFTGAQEECGVVGGGVRLVGEGRRGVKPPH